MAATERFGFARLPRFNEHLALHRIDCLSSHGELTSYDYVREKLAETPQEEIRPKPLLTGRDLIAAGYHPGPKFKEMLGRVEDAQLEGALHTPDQALTYVLHYFPRT